MAFASYGRFAVDLKPPSAEPTGYPPTPRVWLMSPDDVRSRACVPAPARH